jgi:hypothetical protein
LLDFAKLLIDECEKGHLRSIYSLEENKESCYELRFHCYGFISYLLEKICDKAYGAVYTFMCNQAPEIPLSIDHIPCPFHYARFFSSLNYIKNPYWDSIEEHQQLQPGDLIVCLPHHYELKEINHMPSQRPGVHIMLIEEVLNTDHHTIQMSIIDCTRSPHSQEDSRFLRQTGGIGRAPLILYKGAQGYLLQWGSNPNRLEKEVFFGRLKAFSS